MDPQVKKENLSRMYCEGVEVASELLKYVNELYNTSEEFKKLSDANKMRYVRNNNSKAEAFIQVHPIVSQYIISEKIFSKDSFKKYINCVYGYEKTKEDMEFLAKDPKNIYFFKNRQYALYTKFLMREYNKHIDWSVINTMYHNMVKELNAVTEKQFKQYEEHKLEIDKLDKELAEEKKRDFIKYLQDQYS